MNVRLTEDQKALIRKGVETGRYRGEDDAVREAMELWEEKEHRRAEVLLALDVAEASYARQGGRPITEESMRELATEVGRKGRAYAASQLTPK